MDTSEDDKLLQSQTQDKQYGITVSTSGYFVSASQAIDKTAKSVENHDDKRLSAIYAAKAAVNAGQAKFNTSGINHVSTGIEENNNGMSSSLVKVTVSATANNAKQKNEYHHHSQSGTVIHAGQNVNITAQENIEGKGVDIQGHNINLNAGNDIKFDAAQSTEKIKNRDSGNHYGVGVGFGLIGGQNGLSVEIAASQSKGKENGYAEINHNSKVTAGNALNIHSGRDVILDGAELAGNRVTANIGRDLIISSVQDKEKLDSKHTSSGANVSICVPPICYGGSQASGSFNQDRMKNDYASVNEQSGIFAGTGGYDITVGNHTQLNGAVIASTADKDNNRLDTGTIGFTDIKNKAEFEVDSIGMAGGTSHTDGNPKANGGMPSIYEHDDKTSNITHSAISEGELIIRDTDKQIQDINELSHNTEQAHHKLNPIFDKEKEQTRQEIVTGLKDLGAQIKDLKQTMDKQNNHGNENKMGSDFNKGVDSAIVIITGMMTGDIAGGLAGASASWLAEQIKIQAGDNEAARLIAHAILGAAVAELQGNSGLAGGAGALTDEIAADIIRKQLYGDKSVNQLTEEEKQNISALSQLAAGLAAASAGGSMSEVSAAVSSSKNAVENNGLSWANGGLGGDFIGLSPETGANYEGILHASAAGYLTQEETDEALKRLITGKDMPNGSDYVELWMRAPEQIGAFLPGPISAAMAALAMADKSLTDTDKADLISVLNKATGDYLSGANTESLLELNAALSRFGAKSTNKQFQQFIKEKVENNVATSQKGNKSSKFGEHAKNEKEIKAGKGTSGSLTGQQTKLPPNASTENIRSLVRENESAKILSQNGYHVEQNPITSGVKNPDYKINGEIFDNYAPSSGNIRNIWREVEKKVERGQTNNVVINLADTKATIKDLQKQFNDWPVKGLDKIIVIDQSGKPVRIK